MKRAGISLNWLRKTRHASDDQLALYLDGELKPREIQWMKDHLAACWECRTRCEGIERTICDFMEYRRASLGEYADGPRQGWPGLETRLGRLAARRLDEAVTWPLQFPWRIPIRVLWFAALSLILLSAWLYLSSPPTVAAKEALERTSAAEQESLRRVATPVVCQRLAVRRTSAGRAPDQVADLEIWSDVEGGQVRQMRSEPLWKELEGIFEANHMAGKPPLSASWFQSWRASIVAKQERVIATKLAGGDQTLTVKTTAEGPFKLHQIIEASLTVHTTDWRPVAAILRVQYETGIREYQLTALKSEVVSRHALSWPFFDHHRASSAVPDGRKLRLPEPERPSALPLDSHSEKVVDESSEVLAHYALHRAGACRGEAIEVVRQAPGRIVVRGVTESLQRKAELVAVLAGVPSVGTDIQTVEEDRFRLPQAEQDSAKAVFRAPDLPIREQLAKYFEAHPDGASLSSRIASLADQAVTLSGNLRADAWALRRLMERYSGQKGKRLDGPSRRLVQLMARDHIASLEANLARTRTLLEPVLQAVAGDATNQVHGPSRLAENRPPAGGDADWTPYCLDLIERTAGIRAWVNGLFAGAGLAHDPAYTAAQLLADLPELEHRIDAVRAEIARAFSDPSDVQVEARPAARGAERK